MSWKNWLSLLATTALGGAATWATAHFSTDVLTNKASATSFAVGAAVAAAAALAHLFQEIPAQLGQVKP